MPSPIDLLPASAAVDGRTRRRRRRAARIERLAAGASVVSVAVAAAALVGWAAGVDALKSGVPGLVTMKPNTAACLLLASASLWLLRPAEPSPRRRRLGRWAAA